LANIKSAIKRNKQNEKKRVANRIYRGEARTFITKARKSIAAGTADESKEAVVVAISALDKAASKGVIHKNNAARRKSRLMKQLHALAK
jgi:small subunit ribosomal protein S20